MGIDVSGYAEAQIDGKWQFTGRMVTNPDFRFDPTEPELMPEELFHSNSRELAAILTDYTDSPVRSIEPYTPVVSSRSLPADLSLELVTWLERHKQDSATNWFTAREAAEFGWENRIMRRRAFVPREAAPLFVGCPRGFPRKDWPAGVGIHYSEWSRDGVEVEWLESYAEIAAGFACDVLPRLNVPEPPDQIRIIVLASW